MRGSSVRGRGSSGEVQKGWDEERASGMKAFMPQ